MIRYILNLFGRLFGGIAIIFISFVPLILGAAFFLNGCDWQAWTAMFTDPEGLPMSNGLMIALMALITLVFLGTCMYGFFFMLSASKTNDRMMCRSIDVVFDDGFKEVMKRRQEQCSHDTVHQVGFTNLLKCDECGATFENPHFIS